MTGGEKGIYGKFKYIASQSIVGQIEISAPVPGFN